MALLAHARPREQDVQVDAGRWDEHVGGEAHQGGQHGSQQGRRGTGRTTRQPAGQARDGGCPRPINKE
jgi:hypothetical protein